MPSAQPTSQPSVPTSMPTAECQLISQSFVGLHLGSSSCLWAKDISAITPQGGLVYWGATSSMLSAPNGGGDSSYVAHELSGDVLEVTGSSAAFAARKQNGSVTGWGSALTMDTYFVDAELSSGVTRVYSNDGAFVARKDDGTLVAWGEMDSGGDLSGVASELSSRNVTSVTSSCHAFAALADDGSVVSWGSSEYGDLMDLGDVRDELSANVVAVYANCFAFAAVKQDGSVVTWGSDMAGGDSSSVSAALSANVTRVYGSGSEYRETGKWTLSGSAFAAVKQDGSVVTWGSDVAGGDSSSVIAELSSGVSAIASTDSAFAALKSEDGGVVGVVCWATRGTEATAATWKAK